MMLFKVYFIILTDSQTLIIINIYYYIYKVNIYYKNIYYINKVLFIIFTDSQILIIINIYYHFLLSPLSNAENTLFLF